MVNDSAFSFSPRSETAVATLAPASRLRPFFEEHGLPFRDIFAVSYVAQELRKMLSAGPVREGDLVRLNKHLREELHNDTFEIGTAFEERSLASGRGYAQFAFRFITTDRTFQAFIFKDYTDFTIQEKEELHSLEIAHERDISHLACPGLEGLWLKPEKTHPIFIASPSAAGKDELFNWLKRELGDRVIVIPRYTTRLQRVDEINQTNLIFISLDEMREQCASGELVVLEENYGGALYGVSGRMIDENLRRGKIVIVVGNPYEGLESFVRHYPDAATVFISPLPARLTAMAVSDDPESRRAVERALEKITTASIKTRGRSDAERDMQKRLARARTDMQNIAKFDHVFSNERDPLGASGDLFASNYRSFRDLMRQASREGALEGRRPLAAEAATQIAFTIATDPEAKRQLTIRWLKKHYPQARGFITFLDALPRFQIEDIFSRISRFAIVPARTQFVSLSDDERIFSVSDQLLSKDAESIRRIFYFHFSFELAYDAVSGAWTENAYIRKGGGAAGSWKVFPDRIETRNEAIAYLAGDARGEFNGLSVRHQEVAQDLLAAIRRDGFIETLDRATASDDWYERRLAQEALSRVDPLDPARDEICALFMRGLKDRKGQQITIPALRGLVRLGGAKRYEAQLLEADRDLSRPWAREKEMRASVIRALEVIGSEATRRAIMRDIAQDSFYADEACIDAFARFPPEQVIDALILELDHPVSAVRGRAAKSLAGLGYLAIERLVGYYPLLGDDSKTEIVKLFGALPNQTPLFDYLDGAVSSHAGGQGIHGLVDALAEKGMRPAPNRGDRLAEIGERLERGLRFDDEADFRAYFVLTFSALHDRLVRDRLREHFRREVPWYPALVLEFLNRPGYKYRELMIEDLILLVREGRLDPRQVLEKYAIAPSPLIRGAMARLVPYLADDLCHAYLSRFLADDDWFVRKEALYAVLETAALKLTEAEIEQVSKMLLDDFWVNRHLAALVLRHAGSVAVEWLRRALTHDDPRYVATAVPLMPLMCASGSSDEAVGHWRELVASPFDSVAGQAEKTLATLDAGGVSAALCLLRDERAAVRRAGASAIGRAIADAMVPDERLDDLWRQVRAAVEDEELGFVRGALYNAIGACMHRESSPHVAAAARAFLMERLWSEHAIIARWALLEVLRVPDPSPGLGEIRREERIKEAFVAAVNDFNRRLVSTGQSGKVVEAVVMDSSYTKPYTDFITCSDFDFFRVLYTGEIPANERQRLRDTLLDLGIYLVPSEPQWTRLDEREGMVRSATDVTVFRDGRAVDERAVNNDWLEAKTTLRGHFFTMADRGVLLLEELALSKKIYRATVLSHYYHIDTPLVLESDEDLFVLISLIKQEFMMMERVRGRELAVRGKWFTTSQEPLAIIFGGKPLTVADFNRAKGAYATSRFAAAKRGALRPVSLPLTPDGARALSAVNQENTVRYEAILRGDTIGYDTAVVLVRSRSEIADARARIEELRRAGTIPAALTVAVTASDGSLGTEGSLRRFMSALDAAEGASAKASRSRADPFRGKRVLVLDFGRHDALDPFADLRVKEPSAPQRETQPVLIQALVNLSALAATISPEGGVILADMSTLPLVDHSRVTVAPCAGFEPLVLSGDMTQARAYGVYVTNCESTDRPFAFQRDLELTRLNGKGLVFYQGKDIAARHVELGVWRVSAEVAQRLASCYAGDQTACDLPLSKVGYAFVWDRDRFASFGGGRAAREALEGIWDRLHESGAWKIIDMGFARRWGAHELEIVGTGRAAEICAAFNDHHVVYSMTMDTRVGPGSPLWESYSGAMDGVRALFEDGTTTAPYGIEKPVTTVEEAESFASDPWNRAPCKTIHLVRIRDGDYRGFANFASPHTMRYIDDPASDLYAIIERVRPRYLSLHLGYASSDVVVIDGLYRNGPDAAPVTKEELVTRVVAGIAAIERNLAARGLAVPLLIEGLAYRAGEGPGPSDHSADPAVMADVLRQTDAGLLIDTAHVFISGMSFAAEGRAHDYKAYLSLIVHAGTIGRVRELHVSVPAYNEETKRWEDAHRPLYEEGAGKGYVEAIIDYILALREEQGITSPLIINFESNSAGAAKEAAALGGYLMARRERAERRAVSDRPSSVKGDAALAARQEAVRIHAENLKSAYMPVLPGKTILCHMVTDSLIPAEQRDWLKVALEQDMAKDTSYREGMVFVSGANAGDPDRFIDDLRRAMAEQERIYRNLGYTDIRFDVACADVALVNEILARKIATGGGRQVKALAFEPCDVGCTIRQIEGIMLALRALYTGDIGKVKAIFTFLGKALTPEQLVMTDLDRFIGSAVFGLPAAAVEDCNKRRETNDLIVANIKQAA